MPLTAVHALLVRMTCAQLLVPHVRCAISIINVMPLNAAVTPCTSLMPLCMRLSSQKKQLDMHYAAIGLLLHDTHIPNMLLNLQQLSAFHAEATPCRTLLLHGKDCSVSCSRTAQRRHCTATHLTP